MVTKRVARMFTVSALLMGLTGIGLVANAGTGPTGASSYINPDTGAPTENPNVDPFSECETPDVYDVQPLSTKSKDRNVHNDACLFKRGERFDTRAAFQSTGRGFISACPDPDDRTAFGGNNGPKTARLKDTNGDGRDDLCILGGYQTTGQPGDTEYHARMNNTTRAGRQHVTFCYDPDRNGCRDENVQDEIEIRWVRG